MAGADGLTTWTAAPFVPTTTSLAKLAEAARSCHGCPLYVDTEQVVFGEGARSARDRVGRRATRRSGGSPGPSVRGPAGRVLWACLDDAGIDRESVYATNAVKHFKHELRGKRRLHKKPNAAEVEACHPWIEAELRAVRSSVIVALGATAARSLLGRVGSGRRQPRRDLRCPRRPDHVTYHPSAVLRADEAAVEIRGALVADLRRAGALALDG